jgi:hypothetical protein
MVWLQCASSSIMSDPQGVAGDDVRTHTQPQHPFRSGRGYIAQPVAAQTLLGCRHVLSCCVLCRWMRMRTPIWSRWAPGSRLRRLQLPMLPQVRLEQRLSHHTGIHRARGVLKRHVQSSWAALISNVCRHLPWITAGKTYHPGSIIHLQPCAAAIVPLGPEFEAADEFDGARPGYVFGTGRRGTGYYREAVAPPPAGGAAAASATAAAAGACSAIS